MTNAASTAKARPSAENRIVSIRPPVSTQRFIWQLVASAITAKDFLGGFLRMPQIKWLLLHAPVTFDSKDFVVVHEAAERPDQRVGSTHSSRAST